MRTGFKGATLMLFHHPIGMIDYARPLKLRRDVRRVCGPYMWTPTAPMAGRGFYQWGGSGLRCDPRGSTFDLRLEWARDHLGDFRPHYPLGFYCDDDGTGDILRPIIARLPRSRGFLAGWTMGAGMCASLEPTRWDAPEDAAREAYRVAERDAEASREAVAHEREAA